MNFLEFYEPPFFSDDTYVWTNNGHLALMIADVSKDNTAVLDRLCHILNGDMVPAKSPDLEYKAPEIMLNGKTFLVVRGRGSLVENFTNGDESACKIQNDFAHWVISKLQGHDTTVEH